ncbi:MAG: hypothetical protein EBV42_01025 [Actinobacteria bacterium]|nr:hypothetical protein [Actinomycetota bacterium]
MNNSCAIFMPSDKMFMVVDRDYGLTSSATSATITVSDLYNRTVSDITTNTANTILNTYKGWARNFDNGEKTANSPTVFTNRLRFGTYAPLGQSAGACVPAGEGRLNEINAVTGDLVTINGAVSARIGLSKVRNSNGSQWQIASIQEGRRQPYGVDMTVR